MSDESPSLHEKLFVALQHVLPQHALSGLVYRLTRNRSVRLKNLLIERFVRHFRPDMSDAERSDPRSYASFNEFFTRGLRPGARPIEPEESTLVSPVDGAISAQGTLQGAQLLQAKGRYYSLDALLGQSSWVSRFTGGSFVTVYLAPFNYHRIHMPLSGELQAAWYLPGRLFSVNATTAAAVPGLFARNERIVCAFEGRCPFVVILVGALFVGSMSTVWHGPVTPRRPRTRTTLPLSASLAPLNLQKGAELGRFNMGSTVIVLLPPGAATWRPEVSPGRDLVVGTPLARVTSEQMVGLR